MVPEYDNTSQEEKENSFCLGYNVVGDSYKVRQL